MPADRRRRPRPKPTVKARDFRLVAYMPRATYLVLKAKLAAKGLTISAWVREQVRLVTEEES